MDFRLHEGRSGLVGQGFDNDPSRVAIPPSQLVSLPYRPLEKILETLKAPREMDFLSLDIEVAEHFVFSDFDFDRYS